MAQHRLSPSSHREDSEVRRPSDVAARSADRVARPGRLRSLGAVAGLVASVLLPVVVPVIAPATAEAAAVSAIPTRAVPAGSASPELNRYPVPANAIFVDPARGRDTASGSKAAPLRTVARAVAVAATGQTIVLRGGVYHEAVALNKRVTIQGYPGEGAWFDGSVPVTGWTYIGGAKWRKTGWTTRFDSSMSYTTGQNDPRFLQAGYPVANRPDQLFVGTTQLRQVASTAALRPGSFVADYASRTLTMYADPRNRPVAASTLTFALKANVPGIVLRGFGVRRYATPIPVLAAIRFNAPGTIQNVIIYDVATTGLSVSGAAVVDRVTIARAGMIGLHGNYADGLKVSSVRLVNNNWEHFNPWTAAGGMKVTRSRTVQVNRSDVSGNYGTGIWFDESSVGIKISRNSVLDNSEAGIELELSESGLIVGNLIRGGKSGVYLFNTGGVKIFNNAIGGQSDQGIWLAQNGRRQANPAEPGHDPRRPIPDPTNPWLLRNITVANNVLAVGPRDRLQAIDKATYTPADRMNINITGNLFARTGSSMVAWGGAQNVIAARWSTVSQLTAKNTTWRNVESSTYPRLEQLRGLARTQRTRAIGMPSDVAALLGQATGTRWLGTL